MGFRFRFSRDAVPTRIRQRCKASGCSPARSTCSDGPLADARRNRQDPLCRHRNQAGWIRADVARPGDFGARHAAEEIGVPDRIGDHRGSHRSHCWTAQQSHGDEFRRERSRLDRTSTPDRFRDGIPPPRFRGSRRLRVTVTSRFMPGRLADITMLGATIHTAHVQEECNSTHLVDKF